MQDTTSGTMGSQREAATTQPPERANSRSPSARSSSPISLSASGRPKRRQRP